MLYYTTIHFIITVKLEATVTIFFSINRSGLGYFIFNLSHNLQLAASQTAHKGETSSLLGAGAGGGGGGNRLI